MKRYLLLLSALGVASLTHAQEAPSVMSIYQSDAWAKAFAGYYGVDAGVAPKPESADIAILQKVTPLLQSQDELQILAAIDELEIYRKGVEAYSPMIDQVIGSMYFSLGSKAADAKAEETYFKKAITSLELAVAPGRFPTYLQAHKNLGNLYFRLQQSDKALPHFLEAIRLGDNDAISYGIVGAIYYESQKYASAESSIRMSLMLNPDQKEFRRILGLSLFQQERYKEAKSIFEELLQKDPNQPFLWKMVSNTLINTDQIDEAAKILEIVRLMGGAEIQTQMLLGDVYMNKNMVDDAAEAYSQALDLADKQIKSGGSTENLKTFLSPVETLINYQAYELAMSLLDKIESTYKSKLDKNQQNNILAIRSEINIALGNSAEAANNLLAIIKNDPMNGRALLSLGEYYARLQPDQALKGSDAKLERLNAINLSLGYYERAQDLLKTGDKDDENIAYQAFVGAGTLLAREHRLDEALDNLKQAQGIKDEARIADYIEMIKRVQRN